MKAQKTTIGGVEYELRPLTVDDMLTFLERNQEAKTPADQIAAAVAVIAAAIGRTAQEARQLLPMREVAQTLAAVMATAEMEPAVPGEPSPAAVQ